MSGKLYVVGTPIGNLGDFSERAKEVLSQVDFIAAEDTRVTVKLLNHFDIKNELVSYYEHNKKEKGEIIINRILSGENAAIVTDAGMPAISDPGEDLVRLAHERGVPVESVPGPCAFVTALAIAGMSTGRFCFEGFLSVNKQSRRGHLAELKNEYRTMVFYEAPHKLKATLKDFSDTFGADREIALVKEITKLHEKVFKTTLGEAVSFYEENPPKGEFVLIVAGSQRRADNCEFSLDDAVAQAKELMEKGLSASAAAKEASSVTGIRKNEIYRQLI
ncbi:MAG: 16S rRNA (cytidine(1402)-2'-O)-methyltransferase [Clostridia bacterium]|nr:16S rRNA (cytidine(1402)-2'-O)-methyltransferase [Clostridia bacterium]